MRYRCLIILLLLSLAGAAWAQDAATGTQPRPLVLQMQPASAHSVHYRDSAGVPHDRADGTFKFKPTRPEMEAETQPPGIPGQAPWMQHAPVMGAGRMDADGRPPVDCQRTPMDRQCR
jgi:hypothetical protein